VRVKKLAAKLNVPVTAVLAVLRELGGTQTDPEQHMSADLVQGVTLTIARRGAPLGPSPVHMSLADGQKRMVSGAHPPEIRGNLGEAFGVSGGGGVRVDMDTFAEFEQLMQKAGVAPVTTRPSKPPAPAERPLPVTSAAATQHRAGGPALAAATPAPESSTKRDPSPYARELEQEHARLRALLARAEADRAQLAASLDAERAAHADTAARLADSEASAAHANDRMRVLSDGFADALRRATQHANAQQALHEAQARLAEIDAIGSRLSLSELCARRGLLGEDEAWMALAALREAGRHGELLRTVVASQPDAVEQFLDERIALLGPGERPPTGVVAVRVPAARSESAPNVQRAIARFLGEMIALGPRPEGGRREVVVVGGRPLQRRLLIDSMDSRVALRTFPATVRQRVKGDPELIVLWACGPHLEELLARHPQACVVHDGGIVAMLEAASSWLAGR
jgi:hypothetical protein